MKSTTNELIKYIVRVEVLTASSMKIGVFWDIAPCILTGEDQRFRRAYCDHQHHPDNGTVRTSEMSVYSSQITWRYIPEDSHLNKEY
jgi:hypothetical protein